MKGARMVTNAVVASLICFPAWTALAHGSDQPAHQIADLGEFTFEDGSVIDNVRMSYVTHGTLNDAKDNAILFMHGHGANHHLADHLIGPGAPLDTDKYFIIASDSLGNTQVGFEHSTSPTSSGLGMDFPSYNARDMVNAEHKLITEGLGIDHLLMVAGISMGGEKALHFAVSYPEFVDGVMPIVGSALWSSEGFLTFTEHFAILENCEGWADGHYKENPRECAAAALGALAPSFYSREWWNENITSPDEFGEWWDAWYEGYFGVQDARDLYLLGKALGRTTVADAPGFGGDLEAALGAIEAPVMFIVSPYDRFLPLEYIETQNDMIPDSRVVSIDSNAGHLICCGGDPQATWVMGQAIRGFLSELSREDPDRS